MLKSRIIPVLLLSHRGLVKTRQFHEPKYIGDPINAVKIFCEKEADELVFIDINASKSGVEPDYDLIKEIASEAYMPFSYGGGIKTVQQAEKILKNGAEKIILNSILFENFSVAQEMIDIFGASSVVACIDVKKNFLGRYKIFSHKSNDSFSESFDGFLQKIQDVGFGELIIQSVDADGKMSGYDLNLIKHVRSKISAPLVALGGCGSLSDIRDVIKESGADAAAAGSFFTFYGKYRAVLITYPKYDEIQELLK